MIQNWLFTQKLSRKFSNQIPIKTICPMLLIKYFKYGSSQATEYLTVTFIHDNIADCK